MPSEEEHHTEGVVLKAIPFREYDRILTVFSEQSGLLKLFVKNASRPRRTGGLYWLEPFSRGEFLYTSPPGQSQLCTFKEGSLLDSYEGLRTDLSHLEVAGKITQALLATQWLWKSAPLLYRLTLSYFQAIPQSPPGSLLSSFYLKLLRHEGLFSMEKECAECQHFLVDRFFVGGQWLCHRHHQALAPPREGSDAHTPPLFFSKDESLCVEFLAFFRSFSQLAEMPEIPSLNEKIATLFATTTAAQG